MYHSNASHHANLPRLLQGKGKRNKVVKCKSVTYWISKLPLITISSCFPGCLEHCSKQAKVINRVLIILLNSFKHITSALASHWLWTESEFYATVRQKNQSTILQYFYFHIPPLAETETELLFHAQTWGNRDGTGSCKTPKQECIFFKGYTTAFLGPAQARIPSFWMTPPQVSNLTLSFLFSLCLGQRPQQANTFSSELTIKTVIIPAKNQAYSMQEKLPVLQGAAGEINKAMTLGQILSQQ